MNWIALRMLTGNRTKYIGILIGITFASLLIAQQASIFCGMMLKTISQIRDIEGADIWVMDPNVQHVDDVKPLSQNALHRVRSVPGVAWAVPLFKGYTRLRLADGTYQQIILLGLDDGTLEGAPGQMLAGSVADLRQPDAVIMDEAGFHYLWPGEPFRMGKTFEINDHRVLLVGVCKASQTFLTFPIVYSRFSQATACVPRERKLLSFVLAQGRPDLSPEEVCGRIQQQTHLCALSRRDFAWKTMSHYLRRTGIPINFAITVTLGFLVGTAIAGQTFYLFTVENLPQFATLKAMGVTNLQLVGMILLQAVVLAVMGYGLGVGLAALFGEMTRRMEKVSFFMPWQVLGGTGAAVLMIMMLSSVLSIRRVLVQEPAIVFRG